MNRASLPLATPQLRFCADFMHKSIHFTPVSYTHLDVYKRQDKDSFEELYANLAPADPIHFPGYAEKTAELAEKVGMPDAVKTGVCKICLLYTSRCV